MDMIGKGAEAEIFLLDGKIIKQRIRKSYRIPELDIPLRKARTRREAKVIEKLPANVPHPALLKADDKAMEIRMEHIPGDKVRDVLEGNISLCKEIGKIVAMMHDANIIHGDLTTSNMILSNGRIYLIDFGLSFFSHKPEDKAVDLHLLKQALESKHYTIAKEAFRKVAEGYTLSKNCSDVIDRFRKVEARGRHKVKV